MKNGASQLSVLRLIWTLDSGMGKLGGVESASTLCAIALDLGKIGLRSYFRTPEPSRLETCCAANELTKLASFDHRREVMNCNDLDLRRVNLGYKSLQVLAFAREIKPYESGKGSTHWGIRRELYLVLFRFFIGIGRFIVVVNPASPPIIASGGM